MRVAIRKALTRLPKMPTRRHVVPSAQYTAMIDGDTATVIAAGIVALAARIRADQRKAYARLELPGGDVNARRYGPVRFVAMYAPVPWDGREPGMRYRLDVGCA